MPNLTWITKKYFPQLSPQQINLGNCYNWALVAYTNYNNSNLFTWADGGGHAFVKIGSKYFDAQSPCGVSHWSSLESFKPLNISKICVWRQSLREFMYFWYENGKNPILDVRNTNVCDRRNR